ncbi:MAG TPA: type 2 isopentenyl-diphosphate Delta-isomerase [Thermoplasmatales archaeon]|nr:type 2 isopentenyl-diphosphate Delta-isomerase [Thermoplasmatales archaeon]
MNQTEKRKGEHVEIALKEKVSSDYNYWDDVQLTHNALPEINIDEIELSINLFGKQLKAPIIIAGMTGGYSGAKKINENLSAAAEHFQIGLGVGSQRAALEDRSLVDTYSIVNEFDIPLKIANIGASQIAGWKERECIDNINKIVDMIDADALAICLNFLQEAIQPEGEAFARGCYNAIDLITREVDIPVIIKETGAGISGEVAKKLSKLRIAGIDVGGAGGTSFAAIEHYRAKMSKDWLRERLGRTFWNWGIPTPLSLLEVREVVKEKIAIVATGGIRNGLDAAKAIALGADAAGLAHALLKTAIDSRDRTIREMEMVLAELKTAMFLVGAGNVDELKLAEVEVWI